MTQTTNTMVFLYSSSYYDTTEAVSSGISFFAILSIVAVVLNIILFFKIWAMTNNVAKIKNSITNSSNITSLFYLLTADNKNYKEALDKELYLLLCDAFNTAVNTSNEPSAASFVSQKNKILSKMAAKYEMVGAEIPEGFRKVTFNQFMDETKKFQ
jgi:hypothetical protein